ncbi:MAG: SAM-dependent methyltransferase [Aquimarina sp.]|nr:SAM-dependent methyltransferase [Aquimarina sp.]
MNPNIFHKEVQDFINDQVEKGTDINKIILSGSPFNDISIQELAQQIQGKIIAKKKFTYLYKTDSIYYPPKLNLEQTSSQTTAEYKSTLVTGKKLIDITGGLGIDSYFFSKNFENIIHCEINSELSIIAKHNFTKLNAENISTQLEDGLKVLERTNDLDWIYIDPSRRNEVKGKVFFLKDCIPNVPEHLSTLFLKADNIIIKTSPLLDIKAGLEELSNVCEVHIVAVNNEVKELLWILKKNFDGQLQLRTVNITSTKNEIYSFSPSDEQTTFAEYGLPEKYLYEPNAAIMKSGGFMSIGRDYNLNKLHQHSHLYTNTKLIDFPGRVFKIQSVIPYHKKTIQKLNISKANITTRNFPDPVFVLRKKLKIRDGGNDYLFFTTNRDNQRIVIHCVKPE